MVTGYVYVYLFENFFTSFHALEKSDKPTEELIKRSVFWRFMNKINKISEYATSEGFDESKIRC